MLNTVINIFRRMNGDKALSIKGFLYALLFDPNLRVHVIIERIRREKNKAKRRYLSHVLQAKYDIVISPSCTIGNNLYLPHPIGIVVGKGAVLGDNCIIYQNVTLGLKNDGFPVIGDRVIIYAGAQILGNIKIGDGAVIGANAVVLNDIPAGARAVGVPAKII